MLSTFELSNKTVPEEEKNLRKDAK